MHQRYLKKDTIAGTDILDSCKASDNESQIIVAEMLVRILHHGILNRFVYGQLQ